MHLNLLDSTLKPFQMNKLGVGGRRLALGALALFAALLLALQSQSALAHSLSDNSIHGHEPNNINGNSNNNQRPSGGKLMMQPSVNNGNQNRCQSGWMWFNNKCWVTTTSRRDFSHAIELCKKMYNSTLPTIHSEDENEFLRQNIELHNSPIWLYARHNHQYNKTRWLDKSPVNYTRWDGGQPSDKSSLICIKTEESWYMKKAEPVDGQTECVSFWEDAKWGTQVGCLVLLPVVCERKLTPMSRYTADQPSGTMAPPMEPSYGAVSGSISNVATSNNMLAYLLPTFTIATWLINQMSTSHNQKHATNKL